VVSFWLPCFLYFYSVYQLGAPVGNIDTGATWGSYIGLLFLGGAFVAIGVFSSAITNNQIVAFLLAIFLCFFIYTGFDYISRLNIFYARFDTFVEQLGIDAHYQSIGRGVVDTRDLLYFISLILAFLFFTKIVLERRKW